MLQVLLILSYLASKDTFGAPSRRLCNLPYTLYQISLVNSFLLLLLLMDRILVSRHRNMIESMINYGQLQFFVYSNLCTGMFNLLFWTYYEGTVFAITIMFGYYLW